LDTVSSLILSEFCFNYFWVQHVCPIQHICKAVCIALWLPVMNTFHFAYTLNDKRSVILKCMHYFWDYSNQVVVKATADFSYSYRLSSYRTVNRNSSQFEKQNVREVQEENLSTVWNPYRSHKCTVWAEGITFEWQLWWYI
jgi:hypothetical protein